MQLSEIEREQLYAIVEKYDQHPDVQRMREYIQHGSVTTYQHCKNVALVSFWLNRRLRLHADETSLAVGALLHDFYLYFMLRFGYEPGKIYRLAMQTFEGVYEKETILKWLTTFCRRFFNQQFKRSCLPDGPKIGTVALSPRGDWRMPSDACAQVWMRDLEKISL